MKTRLFFLMLILSVALYFPMTWHRTKIKQGMPPRYARWAEPLRAVTDFDVLDDRLIEDGALENHRVMIFFDGDVLTDAALSAVDKWVQGGGILLLPADLVPLRAIDSVS